MKKIFIRCTKTVLTISFGISIILSFFLIKSLWEKPSENKNGKADPQDIEQLSIKTFCLEGQEHYIIRDYVEHKPGFSVVLRIEPNGKPKKCKKESGNAQ